MNRKDINYLSHIKFFLLVLTLVSVFSGIHQTISIQKNAFASSSTVSYTADNSSFANPERGYMSQFGFINNEVHDYTVQDLIGLKSQHRISTFRVYYFFTYYKNSDIPQSVIDKINQDASNFRQAGLKLMPTVSYSPNGDGDAPLSTILRHIDQLTPYYQNNKDIIAAVYGGYFGNYGEMWGSNNGNVDDQSGGRSINDNTIQIFDRLFAAVPNNRSILFRYPVFKRQYTNDNTPTTLAEAFQKTKKSRIGYYNDALLSSDSDGDTGTYSFDGNKPFAMDITSNRNYTGLDGSLVPNSGESGDFTDYPTQNCAAARIALRNLGQDFVHARNFTTDLYGPNGGVNYPLLATWSAEGCYEEIEKNLGYRLRLVDSTIANNSVVKDAATTINLKIVNDGYASPFNPRGLEVILRNQSTGAEYKVDVLNTSTDPRFWLPQKGEFTVSLNPSLQGIPVGNYSIFLNLPDPETSLKNIPDYSIRLANTNIWEASTGLNNLNQSLTITPSVISSSSQVSPSSQAVSSSSLIVSSSSKLPISSVVSSITTTSSLSISNSSSAPSSINSSSTSTAPNQTILKVIVNLSGCFDTSAEKMRTTLNSLNLIPRNQPFNTTNFDYSGQEVASFIPTNIVDWILVEIKDQNGNMVDKKAGLLDEFGNFVDPTALTIGMKLNPSLTSNPYSVNVRHLNHLAIGTNNPIYITANASNLINFTNNSNTKANNQSILGIAKYGMRSGNPSGDNSNDSTDRAVLQNSDEISNTYSILDVNRDGIVDAQDRTIVLNSVEAIEASN